MRLLHGVCESDKIAPEVFGMTRRRSCVPTKLGMIQCLCSDGAELTVNEAGILNLSTTTSILSSSPSTWLLTTKYLGSFKSKAASLPGSRVSVAEKSSFWHEDTFLSSMSVRKYDSLLRWRKAGARPSGYGSELWHLTCHGVGIIFSRV